jgi:hypothetical protein
MVHDRCVKRDEPVAVRIGIEADAQQLASSSADRAASSTASIARPSFSNTFHAAAFARIPLSHVETTTGLRNTSGDGGSANTCSDAIRGRLINEVLRNVLLVVMEQYFSLFWLFAKFHIEFSLKPD